MVKATSILNENILKQEEEIIALRAIYTEDFIIDNSSTKSFSIKIKNKGKEIILWVSLPPKYPGQTPPKYELTAPWMERKHKEQLHITLDEVYLKNSGEVMVHEWVEKCREFLFSLTEERRKIKKAKAKEPVIAKIEITSPYITHGKVITDRKSVFQGHAAEVHSIDEVNAVLAKLKQNKKIANATHNMYAYRIEQKTPRGTTTLLQDCDEDGEAHAGGSMLHLLQILQHTHTLVVVTRWYGGIHLGPDRFRHIKNASRQVIEQAGLLKKTKASN